ncbi:MAG: OmpH family outer membrane protein [Rikenellaceae bacterium]|jgi:outer membrane protein|nr:OmpH family outer membrane protein [Rikenellaceae bacterium]
MKKILLTLFAVALCSGAHAQKYAFVNTESIFKAMPEYTSTLEKIDKLARDYQAQVDAEYNAIAEMYERYQYQKSNLSETARKQIEEQIINREKTAGENQRKVFGQDGELMKKRMEMLKPVQDKVFAAIDQLAKAGGYDMVVDIASNTTLVYYNPALDLSTQVLGRLGITK